MQFRNDIQGLRAVAFLLVFIFHLDLSWLPGGFVGVDVFFVISGYLVSSIILHKKEKQTFGLLEFYIGRVKRIVPVYLFFLLAVFIVGCLIYFPMDIVGLRRSIFHAAIFNSNNYLGSLDTYFGASSNENPILHTWTLAVEMQFYFLLPILLIAFNKKGLFPILIILAALLLGYSYYNSTFLSNKNGMYFSLLARMPEFLIGTIIALRPETLSVRQPGFRNALSFVAFACLILVAFVLDAASNFPGLVVLIPTLSVAFLLINKESFLNQKILSNKTMVYIGELSYSLYLWHWGVMAFLRYSNMRYEFTLLEIIFVTLATFAASSLSYKYIESYFRKKESKSFVTVIAGSIVALGIVAYIAPSLNNSLYPIPKKYSNATFGLKSHSDTFESIERFGDLSGKNDSIVLIGDSFALMYKHVLDEIGKKNGFNFVTVTNDGTPLIPGIAREDFSSERLFERYQKLSKYSSELIDENDVILIASSWRSESIASLPVAFEALAKSLRPTQKVIILANFPSLDKNPIKVNRGVVRNASVNNEYLLQTKQVPESIKRIAEKYPNIYLMDAFDHENYQSEIPFNRDTIMYYDEHHLNILGTDFFSNKIEAVFMVQWNSILSR